MDVYCDATHFPTFFLNSDRALCLFVCFFPFLKESCCVLSSFSSAFMFFRCPPSDFSNGEKEVSYSILQNTASAYDSMSSITTESLTLCIQRVGGEIYQCLE